MLRIVYEYPLPNKRGRYNLSEKELRELLQKAYDNGYNYGYQNALYKLAGLEDELTEKNALGDLTK